MTRVQSSWLRLFLPRDAALKGGKKPKLFIQYCGLLDVSHPNQIVLFYGKKMCLMIKSRSSWMTGKGRL